MLSSFPLLAGSQRAWSSAGLLFQPSVTVVAPHAVGGNAVRGVLSARSSWPQDQVDVGASLNLQYKQNELSATTSSVSPYLTYPLTTRVVGAPQMTSQPVSIFLCSQLYLWLGPQTLTAAYSIITAVTRYLVHEQSQVTDRLAQGSDLTR